MMIIEQFKFLKDVASLIGWCSDNNFIVTAGEMWRPREMQDLYYQTGKSKVKHSKHQDRLAVDLNFFSIDGTLLTKKEEIQKVGDYWESLNPENKWGGNFPKHYPGSSFVDCPHFERCL